MDNHVLIITILISYVTCHPDWNSVILNPVHGLFVKPSSDGATGDLFVAASEDNGVKSQWVVDKPINFLPVAATTQPQAAVLPIYPSAIDESSTKKRAVMPNPVMQYAYALPVTSTEGSPIPSFPYSYPIPQPPAENSGSKCDLSATGPQYPFQYPFNFFYPQIMSAYSNAMTLLKEAGHNEDAGSSAISQISPMWPSPYTYPMYVMVNPGGCSQVHNSATVSTSTLSPSEEESGQS